MKTFFALLFSLLSVFSAVKTTAQNLPKIIRHGNAYQLIVGGKPFLMRAGELGNSNASRAEYFKHHVVHKLKSQEINTALIPVYWDLIEPKEG